MVKKSTVILFEKKSTKRSRQIAAGGRKAEFNPSNTHPDGTGPCGKICSCKDVCVAAYPGDQGATMGMSY